MSNHSSPKSDKIGCLYKAVYVERLMAIIDETTNTYKLWLYPTNSFAVVSKPEFLSAIEQKQIEFLEKMPYDIIQSINNQQSTQDQLKQSYDTYYRRKQSIISSEF